MFRSIADNVSEVVKVVDPDGVFRYANPAIKRVIGHGFEELVGGSILEYVHPEDLSHVVEETEKALREPGGMARNTASYRFRHEGGSWRHVESTGTYLLDDLRVRGVLVISRDVTERKRREETEARLAEAEGLFRSVIEGMGEGLLITDSNDVVLYANPRMAELTAYSTDELLGNPAYELLMQRDRRQEVFERNPRRKQNCTGRCSCASTAPCSGPRFMPRPTVTPTAG